METSGNEPPTTPPKPPDTEDEPTDDFDTLLAKSKNKSQVFKTPVFIGPKFGKKGLLKQVKSPKSLEPPPPVSSTDDTEGKVEIEDITEQISSDDSDTTSACDSTSNVDTKSDEFMEEIPAEVKEKIDTKDQKQVARKSRVSGSPAERLKEQSLPLPYKEPPWSGLPRSKYSLDVLKTGRIISTVDLCERSFTIFGRLTSCNVVMEHPSISRYHAIIQYRAEATDYAGVGFYLYDLASSHGTYINKNRVYGNKYYRIRTGHVLKFGESTRLYIVQGPPDDEDEESDLSVTELMKIRRDKDTKIALDKLHNDDDDEPEEEAQQNNNNNDDSDTGITWGIGEDADESSDLAENPFALAEEGPNEEMYSEDPKRALRGWFEREGFELNYEAEEHGFGEHICKIELPLDAPSGKPIVAESLVRGKKREAVVRCALEACRIIDRYGLMRQSKHESKARKKRNWEDNDYYGSDEDEFLDRTGEIEKKRSKRMQVSGTLHQTPQTHTTLTEKYNAVQEELEDINQKLAVAAQKSGEEEEDCGDSLDVFMSSLDTKTVDKSTVTELKMRRGKLEKEKDKLSQLVNITKPTQLPALTPHTTKPNHKSQMKKYLSEKKLQQQREVEKKAQGEQDEGDEIMEEPIESSDIKLGTDEEIKDETHETPTQIPDNSSNTVEASITDKTTVETDKDQKVTDPQETENRTKISSSEAETPEQSTSPRPDKSSKQQLKINKFRILGPTLPLQLSAGKGKKSKGKSKASDYADMEDDPDFQVWTPPVGQTGDGKTKLNQKYGY